MENITIQSILNLPNLIHIHENSNHMNEKMSYGRGGDFQWIFVTNLLYELKCNAHIYGIFMVHFCLTASGNHSLSFYGRVA